MMKKVLLKVVVLCLLLIVLFFLLSRPSNSYKKVVIVEKYYTPQSKGKAKGVKTKKSIPVISTPSGEAACLMEFDNGKILEMDCDTYVQYSIGEKVKIKYKNHDLIDIRRK